MQNANNILRFIGIYLSTNYNTLEISSFSPIILHEKERRITGCGIIWCQRIILFATEASSPYCTFLNAVNFVGRSGYRNMQFGSFLLFKSLI